MAGRGRGVLQWEITTLHYPTIDSKLLCQPAQTTDGLVSIPLNDARSAEVTLQLEDPALYTLVKAGYTPDRWAYGLMLRCFYRSACVFWGPIVTPEIDLAAGTVKLTAAGPELRLQQHYVRKGDPTSDGPTAFTVGGGSYTTDSRGLRLLRDAALNTAAQTARGVPDLGITDGTASTDNATRVKANRGDEVWQSMTAIAGDETGPDFEITPVTGVSGVYAQLNCYDTQGQDLTGAVQLHYGFGNGLLASMAFTPGGKIITHQHAQSSDGTIVKTAADVDSSAYRGVYVAWQATSFSGDPALLQAWADEQVTRYGTPPSFVTATIVPDDGAAPVYNTDWAVGDVIRVAGARGAVSNYVIDSRIMAVRLRQPDQTGTVQPELDLVPKVTGTISTETA